MRLGWLLVLVMATGCSVGIDLGGTALDAGHERETGRATCASFVPPMTAAACEGCSKGSTSCQANGCFNGYFCDVEDSGFTDCKAPGTPCSMSEKFDGH